MSNYDDAIRAEQLAHAALNRYAMAIATECAPISHMGNGNCGYILGVIEKHLRDSGMLKDEEPSKQKKKKKINGNLRTKVFERDKYRCVQCGSYRDLEADHIHPESLGGETSLDNLQTLCKVCNGKKVNRVIGVNHG